MQFLSSLSTNPVTREAILEACSQVKAIASPDIAVLFFSPHHLDGADEIAAVIQSELSPKNVIGCSCEGVIGPDVEVENSAGISLLVGNLDKANVKPIRIAWDDWGTILHDPEDMKHFFGSGDDLKARVVLADPFTTPVTEMLKTLDGVTPGVPTIGGMASGAYSTGGNKLILNNEIYDNGLVGFALSGDIMVDTLVSQGCRPIGSTMLVTKSEANMIHQLGGKPALEALQAEIDSLSDEERSLFSNGLFLGVVIDEYKVGFERGDFLIRNIIGVEQTSGALVVGDIVRAGQSVQLHVRDSQTANEDLRELLEGHAGVVMPPDGGLVFSCNGRGTRLFETPSHDISLTQRFLPGTPMAGFFAAGELGPVGGRSFIHGHTASFAFFRSPK